MKIAVGDVVHFFAPRYGQTTPIAALATRIDFDPDSQDTRHISLMLFPPGAAPLPLTSVQHRSLWKQASHELDGCWDFKRG